jgi:chorismate--pyruvate lyase
VPNQEWKALAEIEVLAPPALLSWLSEPGLLTARVRELCGPQMHFRMLGPLRDAPLAVPLQARLGVPDAQCLLREIEFRRGAKRIIFAQTILPASTVAAFPWLGELGDAPLGEALRRAKQPLVREPIEYCALRPGDALARAAGDSDGNVASDTDAPRLWARRAVYRLAGCPILVQEVFLPALMEAPVT